MTDQDQYKELTTETPAATPTRHKRRIFIRTALMAWSLIVFTAAIFMVITIPSQKNLLLEEMRRRSKVAFTSTSQVAIESIVLDDFSAVVEHCINLVSQNPGLKYVVLTREDGFSLVHTTKFWKQTHLDGAWTPPQTEAENTPGRMMENNLTEGQAYHLSYPLVYSGIHWGWIHLGLSPDKFYQDSRAIYTRTFMVALLAVVGGLIGSFVYARQLSVPIQRLEKFAQKIAGGDLSQRIDIQTGDEVQSLADSFNHMVGELNRSNRKLIKTARQAGMTEMAVNVLHNVGNVLNSVGVTTQSLKRRVLHSKAASMQSVIDLLKTHEDNLSEFIAKDPKGQKLIPYLTALSQHMQEDHESISTSLNDLERHIQHIQDIVHLQQSYSQTIGLTERVNVIEVIDDAIALNYDAITGYGIRIEKDLITIPEIVLDRQKLLQILTNLISNAKQAFADTNQRIKQITIKTYIARPEVLGIAVGDNGMGIDEKNLTRIFQHGFTTRKDGHGFGLHSSALAASEMNGALLVKSDGANHGATFTLELPIPNVESSDA